MELQIRQERPKDYQEVAQVIQEAFVQSPFSNQKEHDLVERLRKSPFFIPELSLVAEIQDEVVGYVLLTRIFIKRGDTKIESLSLAPIAVKPSHQRKGIGSRLIRAAHRQARIHGFTSIILVGHEDFYPQFGYKKTSQFGIEFPFKLPEENGMVIDLASKGLDDVKGKVEYPIEFFL